MAQFQNTNNGRAVRSESFIYSEAQERASRNLSNSLRGLENIAKQIIVCLSTRFEVSEKVNRALETPLQKTLRAVGIIPSEPARFLAMGSGDGISTALKQASELQARYEDARASLSNIRQTESETLSTRARDHIQGLLESGDKKLKTIASFITNAPEVCDKLSMASNQRTERQLRKEFNQAVEEYRKNLRA